MATIKLTTWNVEWLDRALQNAADASAPARQSDARARLTNIASEIGEIAPDILCVVEGPNSEVEIDGFAQSFLGGRFAVIKSSDGDYRQKGRQWIWFLVRSGLAQQIGAQLLPLSVWQTYTRDDDNAVTGRSWPVNIGANRKLRGTVTTAIRRCWFSTGTGSASRRSAFI